LSEKSPVLSAEEEELLALSAQADQGALPEELDMAEEIAFRQCREEKWK